MKKPNLVRVDWWITSAQKALIAKTAKIQKETQSWVVRQLIDLNLK